MEIRTALSSIGFLAATSFIFTNFVLFAHVNHRKRVIQRIDVVAPYLIHENCQNTTGGPHDCAYVINHQQICSSADDLLFIIYVYSDPKNSKRRNAIRSTWGNIKLFKRIDTRVVFMLGKTENSTLQNMVVREGHIYKDIVQDDFIDSRENRSLKGIMSLKWLTENCANAKYVIKVDDNYLVNVFNLIPYLQIEVRKRERMIICNVDPNNKSLKSSKQKPPPHCQGNSWIITRDLIPELYVMSMRVKPIPEDNVYITGLLPNFLRNISYLQAMSWDTDKMFPIDRYIDISKAVPVMSVPLDNIMPYVWNVVLRRLPPSEISKIDSSIVTSALHKLHYTNGGIAPNRFNFPIQNLDLCKVEDDLVYFVFVYSAPGHFQERLRIRNSWGSRKLFKNIKGQVGFMLGQTTDSSLNYRILYESMKYKDIIQAEFIDSYKNLTFKGISSLQWITTHCKNVEFIIKADDDVLLDMFRLMGTLRLRVANHYRSFFCRPIYDSIVFRSGNWKWIVPEKQMPSDVFPTYCNGPLWVVTNDIVQELYKATYTVPYVVIEDAFTTGLLAKAIGNVRHISVDEFDIVTNGVTKIDTFLKKGQVPPVASVPEDGVYEYAWCAVLQRLDTLDKSVAHRQILDRRKNCVNSLNSTYFQDLLK